MYLGCKKKLYKEKQRERKVFASNTEILRIIAKPIEVINAKEFLTVKDTARLLNCSIRTAYRLIENGNLKAVNISERKTLVKRSDIDNLFA